MTNVLFMGTPEFARDQLAALWEAREALDLNIVGVVSQPDKPKGRGYKMIPTPTKVYAEERGIAVYQPETLKDGAFADMLAALDPALIVVAAYGRILPPYILDYPKFGCINLHGSLLPEYRGAAPMQRAIMQGKDMVGVTTMFMAEGLDTGNMLEKAEMTLTDDDNFETVHDTLAEIGSELLLSTLTGLENNTIKPIPQDDDLATYAAKIENTDCVIDFKADYRAIFNQIRGLSPFPLAFCRHNGKMLKIIAARPLSDEMLIARGLDITAPCGSVLSLDNGTIVIRCQNGALAVSAVLPEGKSRMLARDFINGRKIAVGDQLT